MTKILDAHHRFCEFKEYLQGCSKKTTKWHVDAVRSFLRGPDSPIDLEHITRAHLQNWIVYERNIKKMAPKTIVGRMDSLSLFFDWAVAEKLIQENLLKEFPRPKIPKSIRPYLSTEKANDLIQFTRNFPFQTKLEGVRALAIVCTFIGTGIRRQELLNLELRDVDLEKRTVFVRSGKGAKDRIVTFKYELISPFEAYLKARNAMPRISPYFFVSLHRDMRMSVKALTRLFKKLKDASGIAFSAHILRHTFATLMLEGGCDVFSIKEMMGHSNIQTTCGYLRAVVGHLQEQINRHPVRFV